MKLAVCVAFAAEDWVGLAKVALKLSKLSEHERHGRSTPIVAVFVLHGNARLR